MRSLVLSMSVCFVAGTLGSAKSADKPAATVVTYDQVRAVFKKHCVTCHNTDRPRGDLDLSNFAAIKAGSGSGQVAVAGKSNESLIYTQAAHLEEPFMPPNSPKIPQRELDLIQRWIEGGLAERGGTTPAPPTIAANSATASAASIPARATAPAIAPILRPTAIAALAASLTAPLVAISGRRQAVLFSLVEKKPVRAFDFPEGDVFALRFSRDGELLVIAGGVAGQSGKAIGVEVATGKPLFEVGDEADSVLAVDISPDKSRVALGGPGRSVKLVRTADGEQIAALRKHTDWILSVAFSPDGLLLASSDRFGGLQVWEAESGKELHTLRGHTGAVHDLAWAADSDRLLSAGEDGTLRWWDMHSGKQLAQWEGDAGGLLSVALGAQGHIFCGGRDRKLVVWDGPDKKVRETPQSDEVVRLGLSAGGTQIVIGNVAGHISIVSLTDGAMVGRLELPVDPSLARRPASAITRHVPSAPRAKPANPDLTPADAAAQRAAAELADARQAAAMAEAAVKSAEEALARARETAKKLQAMIPARESAAREAAAKSGGTPSGIDRRVRRWTFVVFRSAENRPFVERKATDHLRSCDDESLANRLRGGIAQRRRSECSGRRLADVARPARRWHQSRHDCAAALVVHRQHRMENCYSRRRANYRIYLSSTRPLLLCCCERRLPMSSSRLLIGGAGIGKSQIVREAVGADAGWITGNASPFGVYIKAYKHRNEPLVLDDVDDLRQHPQGVRLLKSLCQTDPVRTLCWQSQAKALDELGIPREFQTSSPVALIANDWATLSLNVQAVEDRLHLLSFEPSPSEIHRRAASWFWDQEIFDFTGLHLFNLADHSFRVYVRAWEMKCARLDWHRAVLAHCHCATTRAVAALKADATYLTEEDRARAFVAQGFGCRATYFNHAKKLALPTSVPTLKLNQSAPPAVARPPDDVFAVLKQRRTQIGRG